jgi:hypothetical protein
VVQNSEEIDLIRLEGTCRVSTMKIDWKEDENYSKRSKLIMINSSENDISDYKITTILPRKEV